MGLSATVKEETPDDSSSELVNVFSTDISEKFLVRISKENKNLKEVTITF
jgi:hypothetical protein